MERAGRSLAKLKLSGTISADELAIAAWPAAVGKRIASHTRAVALVRGNLVVEVEDAVWQKQLFYLRSHMIRKIREILGDTIVNEVEFRIAVKRRPPGVARQAAPVATDDADGDDADSIEDPILRILYKQARKKAIG